MARLLSIALLAGWLALMLAAVPQRSAHAAGFNCQYPNSPAQQMVCASAALSALNEQLTAAYARAREAAPQSARKELLGDERHWGREVRDQCDSAVCLDSAYRKQIAAVESGKTLQRIRPESQRKDDFGSAVASSAGAALSPPPQIKSADASKGTRADALAPSEFATAAPAGAQAQPSAAPPSVGTEFEPGKNYRPVKDCLSLRPNHMVANLCPTPLNIAWCAGRKINGPRGCVAAGVASVAAYPATVYIPSVQETMWYSPCTEPLYPFRESLPQTGEVTVNCRLERPVPRRSAAEIVRERHRRVFGH